MIQRLKVFLIDGLGIPPVVALAMIGCVAHLVLNVFLRKAATSPWGLLGPLLLGIALESYEIWAQYRQSGLFAPGNDPLVTILSRHALDVLTLLSIPLLLVIASAAAGQSLRS